MTTQFLNQKKLSCPRYAMLCLDWLLLQEYLFPKWNLPYFVACALSTYMTPKQGGREGVSENVKTELGEKRHQAGRM